jgi:hypothetical protein
VAFFTDNLKDAEVPSGGVSAQLLRSIPFGDLLGSVLVRIADIEAFYGPGGGDTDAPQSQRTVRNPNPGKWAEKPCARHKV